MQFSASHHCTVYYLAAKMYGTSYAPAPSSAATPAGVLPLVLGLSSAVLAYVAWAAMTSPTTVHMYSAPRPVQTVTSRPTINYLPRVQPAMARAPAAPLLPLAAGAPDSEGVSIFLCVAWLPLRQPLGGAVGRPTLKR